MAGTIRRGKLTRADVALWDGKTATASRVDATGGTVTGLALGNDVDVLQVFGSGTDRTRATLRDAINHIGSSSVSVIVAPGTWVIDSNLTIPSNLTLKLPAGCILSPDAGVTLTINGTTFCETPTITGGSGTVSFVGGVIGPQRTAAEIAAGVVPDSYAYVPGDPARDASFYPLGDVNFYDWGDVPTRLDADTFTVPGDRTTQYPQGSRVEFRGIATRTKGRIISSTFTTLTTVECLVDQDASGIIPTDLVSVVVQFAANTHRQNSFTWPGNRQLSAIVLDSHLPSILWYQRTDPVIPDLAANEHATDLVMDGTDFTSRLLSDDFVTANAWFQLTRSGATATRCRFAAAEIMLDGFTRVKNGDLRIDDTGTQNQVLAPQGDLVKVAYSFALEPTSGMNLFAVNDLRLVASGANVLALTNANIELRIANSKAVAVNGVTTTGAQTATFSATNKPGSGTAGPVSWLPVTTAGGTQGYIPIFGA